MRGFPLGALLALLMAGPALAQRGNVPVGRPMSGPAKPFVPKISPQYLIGPYPRPNCFLVAPAFRGSALFYGSYPYDYYRWDAPPPVAEPLPPPPDPANDPSRAKLTLHVPVTAEVFMDGQKLKTRGAKRDVLSPPLDEGRRYQYEIRVRWLDKDRDVEQSWTLSVAAGDRSVLMVLAPVADKGK